MDQPQQGSADVLATSPFQNEPDLAPRRHARPRPRLTTYLGAGVLVVAGFLGGVQAQKYLGTTPGSAGVPADIAEIIAQRGGQVDQVDQDGQGGQGGQSGGLGGVGGNTTIGTVKLVDGGTIYVETPGEV